MILVFKSWIAAKNVVTSTSDLFYLYNGIFLPPPDMKSWKQKLIETHSNIDENWELTQKLQKLNERNKNGAL